MTTVKRIDADGTIRYSNDDDRELIYERLSALEKKMKELELYIDNISRDVEHAQDCIDLLEY